ncbi:MAG: anti-sigma factor [Gemmatimonadota bacterium]
MTDTHRSAPIDLAAAYALGALDPAEVKEFEAFLATSPEARRELAEFREVVALIGLGTDAKAALAGPSAALRARVLASAPSLQPPAGDDLAARRAAVAPRPRRPLRGALPLLGAALAASLLLVLNLRGDRQQLRRTLLGRDSALAAQTTALEARDSMLASLLEPGIAVYQLTASGNPVPGVQLFVSRARGRAVLHAFRLQSAPAGRAYQLWFIRDGKPVPSVTFNAGAAGEALIADIALPPGGTISAAAVTEEPAGGSAQPTTAIILVAPLPAS